jgi:hypothetical protein
MTNTTTQTPRGTVTTVPMKFGSWVSNPSMAIDLPDATRIYPDATGTFQVPAKHIAALQNAGLVLVTTSGATVP